MFPNFNTSHVTVYLKSEPLFFQADQFQYISCYCLSCYRWKERNYKQISIHLMLLFIAIQPIHTYRILLYFNTSHVTVYLIELFGICFCHNDFNTSHVTVYHSYIVNCLLCSIFQYISCYCLSISCYVYSNNFCIFQYISCYCLSEKKPSEIIQEFLFQYISCYCLSIYVKR